MWCIVTDAVREGVVLFEQNTFVVSSRPSHISVLMSLQRLSRC